MINSISDGNNKFLSQFVYIFYSECCFFFEHLREQTEKHFPHCSCQLLSIIQLLIKQKLYFTPDALFEP